MIAISINLTKVPKGTTFQGKKGEYLNILLVDNKHGRDEFGNDGFVKIDIPKERRDAGERGEIVGNWKRLGGGKAQSHDRNTDPF